MMIFDHPVARWVILHIINGHLFYISIALLTMALSLAMSKQTHRLSNLKRRVIMFGLVFGIITMAISLPSVTLAWMLCLGLTALTLYINRPILAPILAIGWVIALAYAATTSIIYETSARPTTKPYEQIAVFGDSLSVEFGDEHGPAWPSLLQDELQIPATNFAAKGATVADALKTFNENPITNHLIILVISGNDFLGSTSYQDYTTTLNRLIQTLSDHNNQIMMLEIPTPPTMPQFAWAQRQISSRRAIRLIPKRALAEVLFQHPGATVDGLHLTQKGHQIMAEKILHYLQ